MVRTGWTPCKVPKLIFHCRLSAFPIEVDQITNFLSLIVFYLLSSWWLCASVPVIVRFPEIRSCLSDVNWILTPRKVANRETIWVANVMSDVQDLSWKPWNKRRRLELAWKLGIESARSGWISTKLESPCSVPGGRSSVSCGILHDKRKSANLWVDSAPNGYHFRWRMYLIGFVWFRAFTLISGCNSGLQSRFGHRPECCNITHIFRIISQLESLWNSEQILSTEMLIFAYFDFKFRSQFLFCFVLAQICLNMFMEEGLPQPPVMKTNANQSTINLNKNNPGDNYRLQIVIQSIT